MSRSAIENFVKSWQEEISKIESRAIDGDGVNLIYSSFRLNRLRLERNCMRSNYSEIRRELGMLESRLTVALGTAHSRFRLENRRLLAAIGREIIEKILRVLRSH